MAHTPPAAAPTSAPASDVVTNTPTDLVQTLSSSTQVPTDTTCTESESQSLFNEELFQNTSFIDLLPGSPDINMSCYMSDDEAVGLPRALELSSPIGGSVNVLDMINQDVMFCSFHGAKSNADTQVTYVRAAPSFASSTSAGELLPSLLIPTTTSTDTSVKPLQAYVPPETSSRGGKTMIKRNQKPPYHLDGTTTTRTTVNPFEVNPFVASPSASNGFAATSSSTGSVAKKGSGTSKSSSSSSKKPRSKTHSSHKKSSQSSSKSSKKSSQSSSKSKNTSATLFQKKEVVSSTANSTLVSTVTHTVTRTTKTITRTANISNESTMALGRAVTKTAVDVCSVTTTTSTDTSNTVTFIEKKAATTENTTVVSTNHTVTKARAPVSIISPLRSPYLPTNVLYSTPTIITRSPSASAGTKPCEQYTILPAPTTYDISAKGADNTEAGAKRRRTRLVIPITLNAVPSPPVTTSTISASCKHSLVQAVRSMQCSNHAPSVTSTITSNSLAHTSFALPPGATIYTAKNIPKRPRPAVTTESQTFTIVDSKGAYTTLTISPDYAATASASRLNQTTTATTSCPVTNTSSVTSDAVTRPRSQLLIPIVNSQMNINTSLGYLVTSPIAPPATTAAMKPTTTIASHTITTISSEVMSRIRNRLIYNVPSVSSGISVLPSSTVAGEGSRPRGPVTIISNQLISAVPRGDSSATAASSTNRPLNRLVIPIMSNVHAASTSHSAVSSQGAYIIAGVNQATTMTSDAASRPSRVVIPIIHNSSGAMAATSTTAAGCGSKPSPAVGTCTPAGVADPYSKLRNRLTIQVSTNDGSIARTTSPITAYTITRTRAPQNVYAIPAGTTPYISVTKTSDVVRNPATMTLITFSPPGASAAAGTLKAQALATPSSAESATMTTTTPPLASGTNRFVIKLSTNVTSAAAATTMSTTSVTTPVTTAVVNTTEHRFAEPQPISTRQRTIAGPRTYSLAQRTAAAVPTAPQRTLARALTPRIKKVLANPAPLQIFADVVCPPVTQAAPPTTTTSTALKSRLALSQSSGSSALVLPQYKSAVFKNLSALAHANTERMSSRVAGPRAVSERFVLNSSIAFVSPQRANTVEVAAPTATATIAPLSAASASQRPTRSPGTRSQSARTTDSVPTTTVTTNTKQTPG